MFIPFLKASFSYSVTSFGQRFPAHLIDFIQTIRILDDMHYSVPSCGFSNTPLSPFFPGTASPGIHTSPPHLFISLNSRAQSLESLSDVWLFMAKSVIDNMVQSHFWLYSSSWPLPNINTVSVRGESPGLQVESPDFKQHPLSLPPLPHIINTVLPVPGAILPLPFHFLHSSHRSHCF